MKKIYRKTTKELSKRFDRCREINNLPIVAGGDWNNESSVIKELLPSYMKLCTQNKLTFINWSNPESQGILDYFFEFRLKNLPTISRSGTATLSDHYPVCLESN